MSVFCPAIFILNALLRQIQNPPPPIKMDGKNKYFVKRVDDIKYNKWKHQYIYFTKWRGYIELLWEPVDSVGCMQAAEDFHELHLKLL